jgi:hypothetical protein
MSNSLKMFDGYFLGEIKSINTPSNYRVKDKIRSVEYYDSVAKKSVISNVQTYKDITEDNIEDHFVMGRLSTKLRKVIQFSDTVAISYGDVNSKNFLGKNLSEVYKKALKGNKACQQALLQILYNSWKGSIEIDSVLPNYRGSLEDWLKAGRPKVLNDFWYPKVSIAGLPVASVSHEDVKSFVSNVLKL